MISTRKSTTLKGQGNRPCQGHLVGYAPDSDDSVQSGPFYLGRVVGVKKKKERIFVVL